GGRGADASSGSACGSSAVLCGCGSTWRGTYGAAACGNGGADTACRGGNGGTGLRTGAVADRSGDGGFLGLRLCSEAPIVEAPIVEDLAAESLAAETPAADALTSEALATEALASEALASEALASEALAISRDNCSWLALSCSMLALSASGPARNNC